LHEFAARGNAGINYQKSLNIVFANIAAMQELVELFSPYGVICQCRIFQKYECSSRSSALVRMDCAASASRAIQALNGSNFGLGKGDSQNMRLLLRFADSPEEKATKGRLSEQLFSYVQTRCRYLLHICIADEHAWFIQTLPAQPRLCLGLQKVLCHFLY
jgi:RNA recognition motif-containing protein